MSGHGPFDPERPRDDAELLPALDGRPGPARHISADVAAELVRSAVDRALAAPPEADDARPPSWQGARRRHRLAIAAAVLVGISVGGAAFALVSRVLDRRVQRVAPRTVEPPAPPPPATDVVSAPPPAPEPVPERRVRPAPKVKSHTVGRRPAPPAVHDDLAAADLLAQANARRQAHEWRRADELYQAVVTRFAGADAAVVAQIASASLHLQHLGDARGALATYRSALAARPTGTLGEEARYGIAEAQRALGDAGAEAAALREFVDRHPRSALAPAARRRLDELAR